MAITMAAQLSLVPRRRLGDLLRQRREAYGLSVDDMAVRAGGQFGPAELALIEAGEQDLDDATVEALGLLYEFNSTPPVPQRSKLIIASDEEAAVTEWTQATIREVFVRYLALVYLLRSRTIDGELSLRADDLQVLARAFDIGVDVIEAALDDVMRTDKGAIGEQMDRLRRRLMVPAAGVLVGPTPRGSLVLVK